MEMEEFIKENVNMLQGGFDRSQIKRAVWSFMLKDNCDTWSIEYVAYMCMEVYLEIITRYNSTKQ